MPPVFAAAIGFSPSPTGVAHVKAVLPLLEAASPLYFGSLSGPLDAHITLVFIACIRALVLCAESHAAASEHDAAALVSATSAAADAAEAMAAAASGPDSACVSTLHSAGLFSFLGGLCFRALFCLLTVSLHRSVSDSVFCSRGRRLHCEQDAAAVSGRSHSPGAFFRHRPAHHDSSSFTLFPVSVRAMLFVSGRCAQSSRW